MVPFRLNSFDNFCQSRLIYVENGNEIFILEGLEGASICLHVFLLISLIDTVFSIIRYIDKVILKGRKKEGGDRKEKGKEERMDK